MKKTAFLVALPLLVVWAFSKTQSPPGSVYAWLAVLGSAVVLLAVGFEIKSGQLMSRRERTIITWINGVLIVCNLLIASIVLLGSLFIIAWDVITGGMG
jgi:hypothetical protein